LKTVLRVLFSFFYTPAPNFGPDQNTIQMKEKGASEPKVIFCVSNAHLDQRIQAILRDFFKQEESQNGDLRKENCIVKVFEDRFKIFRCNHNLQLLDMEEISHVHANGEVSKVFLRTKEEITSVKGLNYYENFLHHHPDFFRVHKQTFVQVKEISEFNRKDNLLIMRNGDRVACSRRMGKDLYQYLTQGN
jgi:DNA-binding LytR/AlgR family response regulator